MNNNQVEKTVYTHPREEELGTLTVPVKFIGCQVKPDTNNRVFKVHMVQLTKYRENHNSGYSLLEAEVYASARPDVFIPFGRGSEQKLKDYLADKKIPQRLRGNIPVLAVDNTIYIVADLEISDLLKVDENSTNLYKINYEKDIL